MMDISDVYNGDFVMIKGAELMMNTAWISLNRTEQRELIMWLWKNKPELMREIVCENCPEVC
jgi:hypothetical protein